MARVDGARLLVVDDHAEMARLLADQLADAGYAVQRAAGGRDALARARAELPDLVLTDLRMEEVDGFDVLAGIRELDPGVPVIVMTAFGAIETAIEAIKRGAYHYVTKPFQLREILLFVDRALADRRLRSENALLRRDLADRAGAAGLAALVGTSPPMAALHELIRKLAPSPAPVLITGESGTGKELVARALHAAGPRAGSPFVAVSCNALAPDRLLSELFGHVRGALPGADSAHRGLFAEADGGTLFLDEIGDMPLELQAKLLRVLEDGEVRPVGADTVRRVDVRVLAATNQRLPVDDGRFRQDLYFRLGVLRIAVPPLRDRREDIPALVERFIERSRARYPGSPARRLTAEALRHLQAHAWPGNVRELENVVEQLVLLTSSEEIGLEALDAGITAVGPSPLERAMDEFVPLRELEARYVAWAIDRCGGDELRAAERLGLDELSLRRLRRERERAAERDADPEPDGS